MLCVYKTICAKSTHSAKSIAIRMAITYKTTLTLIELQVAVKHT